jgi:hypothetical protein
MYVSQVLLMGVGLSQIYTAPAFSQGGSTSGNEIDQQHYDCQDQQNVDEAA